MWGRHFGVSEETSEVNSTKPPVPLSRLAGLLIFGLVKNKDRRKRFQVTGTHRQSIDLQPFWPAHFCA